MKKGEMIIPTSELEARIKNLSARVDSILAGIAYDLTNGTFKNFMICSGTISVPSGSDTAAITFTIPFAVAPRIVATPIATNQDFNVVAHTVGVSSFIMRGYNRTSGASVDCHWIAFGKRI